VMLFTFGLEFAREHDQIKVMPVTPHDGYDSAIVQARRQKTLGWPSKLVNFTSPS